MKRKLPALAAWVLACASLLGCAAEVIRHPSELVMQPPARQKLYRLTAPAELKLDSGYERRIASGTEFVELGTVREGSVLRPTNATLTVEGAHMHEAYAVVQDGRLVGFYLPVEKSFSPLKQTVSLSLQERKP